MSLSNFQPLLKEVYEKGRGKVAIPPQFQKGGGDGKQPPPFMKGKQSGPDEKAKAKKDAAKKRLAMLAGKKGS